MASSRWSAPAPEAMPIVRTGSGPSVKASGSRPVASWTRATSSAGAMPGSAKRARTPMVARLWAREGLDLPGADGPREQRVVADLEVAVEGQVVGGEREVGVEEQLQAALGGAVERARRPGPEEPVVDEHEVGALLARASEQLDIRRDAGYHGLDLLASGYLQSVGPVVVVRGGIQKLVEVANDLIAGCHRHRHRCSLSHAQMNAIVRRTAR